MTNITGWKETQILHKVSVPNPATRRDLADLLTFADMKYRELHPDDPHIKESDLYDDAYMIEATDDKIVATIIEEVGRG